jgi:heptosyltransferase II
MSSAALKSDSNEHKLLVRMPNWIGDCVMALPALYYLQERGYQITLIGKSFIKDIFGSSAWPLILISADKKHLSLAVRANTAKHVLLLTNSLSSALLGVRSGKRCYGYRGDWRSLLLAGSFARTSVHEAASFLRLAMLTDAKLSDVHKQTNITDPHISKISLPDSYKSYIANKQHSLVSDYSCLADKYILLCPFAYGAGINGDSKVWPSWPEFIKQMSNKQQYKIICCPGPGERDAAANLAELGVKVLNDVDLATYLAIMSQAAAIVGNDTGSMHLAAAVNTNCLTLFGASDPKRVCPIGSSFMGAIDTWPGCNDVFAALQVMLNS